VPVVKTCTTVPVVVSICAVASRTSTPVSRTKKADVAEHPEVFNHVGLLVNESPGMGRVALYLASDNITESVAIKRVTGPSHTFIVRFCGA
jgi:hypothetical protein